MAGWGFRICFSSGIHVSFVFVFSCFRVSFCFGLRPLMTRSIGGAGCLLRKVFRRLFPTFVLTTLLAVSLAAAQDRPEEGGHEIQVWTGGGHSVPGGTSDTSIWDAGIRYGWILTQPHLPGFLSGRFELAVDAVPAYVIFQRANTAYGGGVNPVGFKWIFATRGRVAPFLELNGGTLFTTHEVPKGTSNINFTPGAAFGMYFFGEHTWSVDVRYLHISNAGLTVPNPGVNTVQVRLGFGKFFGRK
jgi:Lipid A 3-O-deacylase (PagL)